ncbi:MAG: SIS domain-containing protein [Planctomycetes bacterium]|nr:SIS domain-containing protein [Planctomycetota bacterium]
MEKQTEKIILDTLYDHSQMLSLLKDKCISVIAESAEIVCNCLKNGGCIYICGNGGSAADAQHIAAELVGRFILDRKAFAAVALSTDSSVITSIGNDYSYKNIFARQVQALAKKEDILWAISTSGSSENIIEAVKTAKQKKCKILAFTGKENAPLQQLSDVCFCAPSKFTARSQEMHQLAYHIICDLVEKELCQD